MAEFVCVDGPLSGQVLAWPATAGPQEPGGTLTVAVVDVGLPEVAAEDEPEADYRVERMPEADLPGLLRFVAGRGPWRGMQPVESLLEV